MWNADWTDDLINGGDLAGRVSRHRGSKAGRRRSGSHSSRFESLEMRCMLSASAGTYETIAQPIYNEYVGTPGVIELAGLPSGVSLSAANSYQITQQPGKGSLAINSSGELVYSATQAGTDSFTIQVNSSSVPPGPDGETYAGYSFTVDLNNQAAFQQPAQSLVINAIYGADAQYPAKLFPVLWADLTGVMPKGQQWLPGSYETLVVPPKDGTFNSTTEVYTANPGFAGTDTFTVEVHAVTANSTMSNLQYFNAEVTIDTTVVPGLPVDVFYQDGAFNNVSADGNIVSNNELTGGQGAPGDYPYVTYAYNDGVLAETITVNSATQLTASLPSGDTYLVDEQSSGAIVIDKNGQTIDTFTPPAAPDISAADVAGPTLGLVSTGTQVSVVQGQPATLSLPDLDQGELQTGDYVIVTEPQEGTVSVNSQGQVVYTATGSDPTDSFTIEAPGTGAFAGETVEEQVNLLVSPAIVVPPAQTTASVSVSNTSSTALDLLALATAADASPAPAATDTTAIVVVSALSTARFPWRRITCRPMGHSPTPTSRFTRPTPGTQEMTP